MRYAKTVGGLLVLITAMLLNATAYAQRNGVITEEMLRAPWTQHLAVVESLSDSIEQLSDAKTRAQMTDALTLLQVTLGEYEVQVDQVIDRIATDVQFPYAAAETSRALAAQLGEIRNAFERLYQLLDVQQRADARRAQAALDELREALADKLRFESEVLAALGSGLRQQRVDLATRWWKGEERAIELRKTIAALRERLETVK
ncbi:MAG TPA: hypothetical protein VFB54_02605 [Burkholderiales bacterium]|nr:hypothetical protein [Burkholderiales bacterium]